MEIQIFKTPSGDEMVILPRAEYEALVAASRPYDEDADDVAIFDQRMAALQAGQDGLLPLEVSAMILKGDSRIRALRKWRQMTQQALAEKAGIGQGYLSSIESGTRAGSPETLTALAGALDVPVEWIA